MIRMVGAELEPAQQELVTKSSVLIVDDDEDQSLLLEFRLQQLGFKTLAARDGSEAVDVAKSAHPDLILLDLRLPDIDGLRVCQTITDAPDTCDIPVIIVSAVETPDIVRVSRAAGSQFYVRKPYDPNVLIALILQSLSGNA
jgi:CheY-like chemotaxis protein